jgi:hypothetical protein
VIKIDIMIRRSEKLSPTITFRGRIRRYREYAPAVRRLSWKKLKRTTIQTMAAIAAVY